MRDTFDILVNGVALWLLWTAGQAWMSIPPAAAAPPAPATVSSGPARGVAPVHSPDGRDVPEPVRLSPIQPPPARARATAAPPPAATVKPAPVSEKRLSAPLRTHATLSLASEASIKSNRPILAMFVGAPGTCPKCEAMKRHTLVDRSVIDRLNAEFEFVVVDGDANPVLADQFGVREYPTFAVAWPVEERANKFIPPDDAAGFLSAVSFAKGQGE